MVASCVSPEAGATVAGAAVRTPAKLITAIRGLEFLICRIVIKESLCFQWLSIWRKICPQALERATNEFIRVAHFGFVFLCRFSLDTFRRAVPFVQHLI